MVSQTCSCFSTLCCGKADVDLDALSEGLDVSFFNVSLSMGSIASCVVKKTLACIRYGSIFTSILLVKVV